MKKTTDRYATAKEFAAALTDFLRGGTSAEDSLPLAEEIESSIHPAPRPTPGAVQPEFVKWVEQAAQAPVETKRPTGTAPQIPVVAPKARRPAAPEPPRRKPARSDARPLSLDDLPPDRDEWLPAARGMRLSWIGMVLATVLLLTNAITAVVGSISRGGDAVKAAASTLPARSADPTRAGYEAAYLALGAGQVLGLILMGTGRWRATRLPVGIRGAAAGRTSAVAAWLAAAAMVVPLLLFDEVKNQYRGRDRYDDAAVAVAVLAGVVLPLLLIVGEFAFNRYLTSVGRHLGPEFPRSLTRTSRIFLQNVICFALLAAAFGGAAAWIGQSGPLTTILAVLAGLSACMTLALFPMWFVMNVWLGIRAAGEAARLARGVEDE